MPVLTGISGCLALSQDFMSRCWRVELTGWQAKEFPKRSTDMARKFRRQITLEILHALEHAPAWEGQSPTNFRGGTFEKLTAAAYCHVFGLSQNQLRAILERHQGHLKGLTPDAISHYLHAHPKQAIYSTFQSKSPRTVEGIIGAELWGEVLERDQGTRAKWRQI